MKIYSWNVNGIRAVEKKGFVDWVKKEKPDILCVQETKADISQLSDELVNIPGYRSWFNSAERKGYSGVAMWSAVEPVSVETGLGDERFAGEGRVLISTYEGFTLLNIYFPNGQKDEERLQFKLGFYDAVLDLCESLRSKGQRLVICGDYNTAHREIDLKNPKQNSDRSGFLPIEREWIDRFIEAGYVDTFRHLYPVEVKYSWWSYRFRAREKGIGWRIDYHFVSDDLIGDVKDSVILDDVMGSDHCPIVLDLDI